MKNVFAALAIILVVGFSGQAHADAPEHRISGNLAGELVTEIRLSSRIQSTIDSAREIHVLENVACFKEVKKSKKNHKSQMKTTCAVINYEIPPDAGDDAHPIPTEFPLKHSKAIVAHLIESNPEKYISWESDKRTDYMISRIECTVDKTLDHTDCLILGVEQ